MSEDKYKEMTPDKEKEIISKINMLRDLLPPSPFDFLFDRPKPTRGEFELVTNFNKDKYGIYEEALERYKLLSDKPKELKLDIASNEHCDYGLWVKVFGDLSVFWTIYREVEEANK